MIISGIDLFCGIGGLTHGLLKGGVRVVAGFDLDPACKFAYEANNRAEFIAEDVRTLQADRLAELWGRGTRRLLAGCAPCQPFSTYSRSGRGSRADTKWDLVVDFARLVRDARPDFVTMENVPQLINHEVFDELLAALQGYHTWAKVVDCVNYGVPQTRKRLVVLASKLGEIALRAPLRPNVATVRRAIGHLPPLRAGEVDPVDPLHAACKLSPLNLRRIKASKPGGTWRDWPPSLIAPCHRRTSGGTYPSVYGRMAWDSPAPTITTQSFGYGNGRFGHPQQDRAITLREAAALQTFPANYRLLERDDPPRYHVLGRLIGNAVPVKLGEAIGHTFLEHARLHGPRLASP